MSEETLSPDLLAKVHKLAMRRGVGGVANQLQWGGDDSESRTRRLDSHLGQYVAQLGGIVRKPIVVGLDDWNLGGDIGGSGPGGWFSSAPIYYRDRDHFVAVIGSLWYQRILPSERQSVGQLIYRDLPAKPILCFIRGEGPPLSLGRTELRALGRNPLASVSETPASGDDFDGILIRLPLPAWTSEADAIRKEFGRRVAAGWDALPTCPDGWSTGRIVRRHFLAETLERLQEEEQRQGERQLDDLIRALETRLPDISVAGLPAAVVELLGSYDAALFGATDEPTHKIHDDFVAFVLRVMQNGLAILQDTQVTAFWYIPAAGFPDTQEVPGYREFCSGGIHLWTSPQTQFDPVSIRILETLRGLRQGAADWARQRAANARLEEALRQLPLVLHNLRGKVQRPREIVNQIEVRKTLQPSLERSGDPRLADLVRELFVSTQRVEREIVTLWRIAKRVYEERKSFDSTGLRFRPRNREGDVSDQGTLAALLLDALEHAVRQVPSEAAVREAYTVSDGKALLFAQFSIRRCADDSEIADGLLKCFPHWQVEVNLNVLQTIDLEPVDDSRQLSQYQCWRILLENWASNLGT